MKIVLLGDKTISVRCLEFLVEQKQDVLAVFVHKENKRSDGWQDSLKETAETFGLDVYEGNVNNHADKLRSLSPDVVFSVQYGPLLKSEVLGIPRLGCINLHNGDLPRYGGCGPVYHAVMNGEKKIGVTLHYMDEKFDEGDVISKKHVDVSDNDTSGEAFEKVTDAGVDLFREQYDLIANEKNDRVSQSGEMLYFDHDVRDFGKKEGRRVDWAGLARDVHNSIRAFTFKRRGWAAITRIEGEEVQVSDSRIESGSDLNVEKRGQVLDVSEGRLFVGVGDGVLSIGQINGNSAGEYLANKDYQGMVMG